MVIESDLLPEFCVIEDIVFDDLHSYYFVLENFALSFI